MKGLIKQYRNDLLENVIPFWSCNSLDEENGGYLTSLNRDGSVFDTDHFTWRIG